MYICNKLSKQTAHRTFTILIDDSNSCTSFKRLSVAFCALTRVELTLALRMISRGIDKNRTPRQISEYGPI